MIKSRFSVRRFLYRHHLLVSTWPAGRAGDAAAVLLLSAMTLGVLSRQVVCSVVSVGLKRRRWGREERG